MPDSSLWVGLTFPFFGTRLVADVGKPPASESTSDALVRGGAQGDVFGPTPGDEISPFKALVSELGAGEDKIAAIALRYILSHPAVSTVIPGMRSVRNVERNMAVGDGKGLPEDQLRILKNHRWDRNFYA